MQAGEIVDPDTIDIGQVGIRFADLDVVQSNQLCTDEKGKELPVSRQRLGRVSGKVGARRAASWCVKMGRVGWILVPREVALIRSVPAHIASGSWMSQDPPDLESAWPLLLATYQQGTCDETKLFELWRGCGAA